MTTEMDSARQQLLDEVKALVTGERTDIKAKQAAYYVDAFFRRVPAEDLGDASAEVLAAVVSSQMQFIRKRLPGESKVDVFNPDLEEDGWESQHTVIELVNEDRPFLVDTANMVVAELNLNVHLMVHPLVNVDRDESGEVLGYYSSASEKGKLESIIHMQVDRQNDPEVLARINSGMRCPCCRARLRYTPPHLARPPTGASPTPNPTPATSRTAGGIAHVSWRGRNRPRNHVLGDRTRQPARRARDSSQRRG